MPKNCASFTRHSRHRPSGWCAVQSDSTVLLSAHRFLSPTHSSSKALSQMPKTLPTSSTRSKYLVTLSLSPLSFLFHPPSSIHIHSHTNIPRQLRQTASLASHPPYYAHALPRPTADETHCRPTVRATHDKTRQQLLYHQSGYTAQLPSATLPTLRRCRGVAAARLRARFVGSPLSLSSET
jgi:hypothetical protein